VERNKDLIRHKNMLKILLSYTAVLISP